MNRLSRINIVLSKSALETKAQIEKAAETNYVGRKQRNKKVPSVIHSGERKDVVPMLQKQLLHSYIGAIQSKNNNKNCSLRN